MTRQADWDAPPHIQAALDALAKKAAARKAAKLKKQRAKSSRAGSVRPSVPGTAEVCGCVARRGR